MHPTVKAILYLLLDVYQLGRAWMLKKRIPLWVAPLTLIVLFAACNVSRGTHRGANGSSIRASADMCYREYAHRHGDGNFRVTEARAGDKYNVIRARVSEGSLDCMVETESEMVVMFKIW